MSAPETPQKPSPPPRTGSLRRRIAFAIAGVFALYVVLGYVVVPAVVESQLAQFVEAELGVKPEFEDVSFDPFDLRLTLWGVELPGPGGEGTIASFERLAVDVHLLGFLSADLALEEVLLVGPRISAVVDESGALNLSQLLAGSEEPEEEEEKEEEEPSEPFIVDIEAIRIVRGFLRFEDRSQSPAFEVELGPLALEMEGFTTRPDEESPYSLVVRLDDTELEWSGTLAMDPIRSQGEISLSGFPLRVPWDYVSDQVRFEVEGGELDLALEYRLDRTDGFSLRVEEGRIDVRELEILDVAEASRVLSIGDFEVAGVDVEANHEGLAALGIDSVNLAGGRLVSRLERDGSVHLLALFTPNTPEGAEEAAEAAAVVIDEVAKADTRSTVSAEKGAAAGIRIDRIEVADFEIDFEDRSRNSPVPIQLSSLELLVEDYKSDAGAPLRVDLSTGFGERGKIAIKGPVTVEPLSTELAIEASQIDLGPFEPYFEDVARIDVTSGSVAAKLDLSVKSRAGKTPNIAVRGRIQLDDFVGLDRRHGGKFVEWKRVRVEGLDYGSTAIRIAEVALTDARVHLTLDREGRSNIDAIFGGEAAEQTDETGDAQKKSSSAEPVSIEIARITLDGLGADMDDQSMEPHFKISLDDLKGTVEGLSSADRSRAKVDLQGLIDDVAPVRVEGQINPLSGDAYTDIKVKVNGVSLPAFSPYSGRFVGYSIDRGKLDLDLHYELNARHLKAKNFVALNQFGFGGRVESKQATSLPVTLAAVLLKDPKGNIEIRLPVEGDIDDPSFDIVGLLAKTIVNLVTRVATSPFNVVAGLVGAASEDLSKVAFASGSAVLSGNEKAELEKLAGVLVNRRQLKVEIRGRADPEIDGPGWRASRIEEALQQSAFQSLSRRARERVREPAAIELTPGDRLAGLERLYSERIAGSLADQVPKIPSESRDARTARLIEEATARLGERIEVGDEDWRSLARARASAIQSALLAAGDVRADQVFLIETEVGAVGAGDIVSVELSLGAN